MAVPQKLNMKLPYNLVILLLGIYPREMKTYIYTKLCAQIFRAALLFTVAEGISN